MLSERGFIHALRKEEKKTKIKEAQAKKKKTKDEAQEAIDFEFYILFLDFGTQLKIIATGGIFAN